MRLHAICVHTACHIFAATRDGGRRIVAPAGILGGLFDLADQIEVPDKFMADRDDRPPQKQKLF
jgi:hypothetical protein